MNLYYTSTLVILALSIIISPYCMAESELNFQISAEKFEANQSSAIPSYEKIYNKFVDVNKELADFDNKYKDVAKEYNARDRLSATVTPIVLSSIEQNDGFDQSTKQTYFLNSTIVALYISYSSSHAHGKERHNGFFVIYEMTCIHSNSIEGTTVGVSAKATLKNFSSVLDIKSLPTIEEVQKASEKSLRSFKNNQK